MRTALVDAFRNGKKKKNYRENITGNVKYLPSFVSFGWNINFPPKNKIGCQEMLERI